MNSGLYIRNMTERAIVVDVDGTLAIRNGRDPHDWRKAGSDLPNQPVVELVKALANTSKIIFVTGRMEIARELTATWLNENVIPPGPIYMRADGDYRPDWQIKKELFNNHIRDEYNTWFVLDDRNQTVDMWRSIGLTCLQVAPGDF